MALTPNGENSEYRKKKDISAEEKQMTAAKKSPSPESIENLAELSNWTFCVSVWLRLAEVLAIWSWRNFISLEVNSLFIRSGTSK